MAKIIRLTHKLVIRLAACETRQQNTLKLLQKPKQACNEPIRTSVRRYKALKDAYHTLRIRRRSQDAAGWTPKNLIKHYYYYRALNNDQYYFGGFLIIVII